jgi:hypothetical protein
MICLGVRSFFRLMLIETERTFGTGTCRGGGYVHYKYKDYSLFYKNIF